MGRAIVCATILTGIWAALDRIVQWHHTDLITSFFAALGGARLMFFIYSEENNK